MHVVSLTDHEGKFISKILSSYGKHLQINCKKISLPNQNDINVNAKFIVDKNKLYRKKLFASESDLETFIIFSLGDKKNGLFKKFSRLLSHYPDNDLDSSLIYNQFIFGNAYPADIVAINTKNINIFELKKNWLRSNLLPTIKKEMRKHCCYSLFSNRIPSDSQPRMNFYLLVLKDKKNLRLKIDLINEFSIITKSINKFRENNFNILEYYIEKNQLFLEKL